jgi:hypothetical protein
LAKRKPAISYRGWEEWVVEGKARERVMNGNGRDKKGVMLGMKGSKDCGINKDSGEEQSAPLERCG